MTALSPHIVIIGAGLIGLSCADSLLSAGMEVTLLEARSGPVQGASFANSGMIHPSQSGGWAQAFPAPDAGQSIRDFALKSRDLLERRMDSLGLKAMRARPRGCYQLFDTDMAARQAQADYAARQIQANPVTDPVSTFSRPGLYFPDDRSGDARAYGRALAESVQERGGLLITDATEVRLHRHGGSRVGVRLGTHRFKADHVIIACGAQSPALLAQLGLTLPVVPIRGWAADFARPDKIDLPRIPVMDVQTRSAFTPFRNRIRLSGTLGEASAAPLLARWADILPVSMQTLGAPLQIWSGLRPVSQTGAPIIGRVADGLWVNAGHAHMGWTLCAASGRLMSDLIAGKAVENSFDYTAT
ncbi:NAD(P)/FAD-dependent oxidoreductase [Algimonas porphyrae]